MKKRVFYIIFLFSVTVFSLKAQTVKILFDASKAEQAGNADWVVDADAHNLGYGSGPAVLNAGTESNAQRIPTPTQNNITGSTSETYWNGALSYWGVDCARQNYIVESLPYNGQITYGIGSNAQDLSNYSVFIVCEPNILFTASEKTAILNFVLNGGGLFMISDHDISDRNNDGEDSPLIWNDLMSNNSVQVNPFGMSFDYADFSQLTTNIPSLPGDSILNGPFGSVTAAQWNNGTSITLNPAQNSTVKGVIYKTGSSFGNTNVMCAYARYGSGKVAALGDSSPCDDGTGDPNDNLFPGYAQDASGNHRKLLMNIAIWLATPSAPPAPVADFSASNLTPCTTESIVFTDNSSSGITSYSWNFGSGASPATANTAGPHSVTYSTSGLKTVSLTVTSSGGSNTNTKTNYINVNGACSTLDVGVFSLLSPATNLCPVNGKTLQVRVKNYGSGSINFSSDPVPVFISISDPSSSNQIFSKILNSGSLAAGATLDLTFSNTYDFISSGNYIINSYTSLASDANTANDAMTAVNVTVSPGFQTDYTVLSENMGTVSSTTAIAVHEGNNGFENDNLTMSGTADVRATQTSLGAYSGASGGANVFFTNSSGRYFMIAGLNTSAYSNLQLSLGFYKNTASTTITDFKIQVGTDGLTFSDLTIPVFSGGAGWYYITPGGSIPSDTSIYIRFLQNSTSNQYRVDDLLLIEHVIAPTITASGPLSFCQGGSVTLMASPAVSYLWSNGMTTQNITVSATGNYSVTETNASGCTAVSNSLSVTAFPVYSTSRNRYIAQGSSYTLPDGIVVNTSGTYSSVFQTTQSCDSTIITVLSVVNVSDNNLCTDDACDSLTGSISHTPVNPDDGNPCTIDGCDPQTGVYHTPVAEICGNGIDDNCNGQIDEGCFVTLHLKVLIEGYYRAGNRMVAVSNPAGQVYICDTLTAELHNSVSPYSLVQTVKSLIDTSGNGNFVFPGTVQGQSFYLVVKHRSSLETWSAAPLLINDSSVTYNFSDASSKAYGSNLKNMGSGSFALISGDVNQDGIINLTDLSTVENSCFLFATGYKAEDLNGDRVIESADCSLLENNITKTVVKP